MDSLSYGPTHVGKTMDAVIVAIAADAVTQIGPAAKGLALDEIAPPTA